MNIKFFRKTPGFTLIELIAVLILAAIVALVAISVLTRQTSNLRGRAEALKSHVRYAQAMAMSTDNRNWGIRFDTETEEYWLFYCNTATTCNWLENQTHIPGTGPGRDTANLEEHNININSISQGESRVTLAFGNFGTPYWGGEDQVLENLLSENFTITLADQAGRTENINVIPATGAVP